MKRLLVAFALLLCTGWVAAQDQAYVDYMAILDTMPSRVEADKNLEELRNNYFEELELDQQRLQEDINRFIEKRDSLSPFLQQREEERLTNKQQELQKKQATYEQELQRIQAQVYKPVSERLQLAIDNVCKREEILFLHSKDSLLYAGGKDLTALVITEVLRLEKEAKEDTTGTPANGQ